MELFDKDAKPIVQSPPPGKFSSINVQWQYLRLSNSPYPVQQVCHIPYERVSDFIRGEAENPDHPTTFRIYSSRRRRRHSKTAATTFRTYSEELTYEVLIFLCFSRMSLGLSMYIYRELHK